MCVCVALYLCRTASIIKMSGRQLKGYPSYLRVYSHIFMCPTYEFTKCINILPLR